MKFSFKLIVLSQNILLNILFLSEFTCTDHKKCSQFQKIHYNINTQSSWHHKLFKNFSWFWAPTLFTTWLAKFEYVTKVSMKAGVFYHKTTLGLLSTKVQTSKSYLTFYTGKSKSKLYLNHTPFKTIVIMYYVICSQYLFNNHPFTLCHYVCFNITYINSMSCITLMLFQISFICIHI